MDINKITEKITGPVSLLLALGSILGISFGAHVWLSTYFVTTTHFDNSVKNLETKIDKDIAAKMDEQFLVLRKNINATEYNVLGSQLATIQVKDKFKLSPYELDNITKMVRKHCMLGMSLGYMPKDTDCEEKLEKKLNGGL